MGVTRKVWKPPYVTVEWLDACVIVELHGTLNAVLDKAKLKRRESQGWLIRHDDALTVIARDYDAPDDKGDEPEVGDVQVMPSDWVLAVRQGRRKVSRAGNSNRNENLSKDGPHLHQEARSQEGSEGRGAGLQRDGERGLVAGEGVPQGSA